MVKPELLMLFYNNFKGNLPVARSTLPAPARLIRFFGSFSFLLLFKFLELQSMTRVEMFLEVSCRAVRLCALSPPRNSLSTRSTNGFRLVDGTNGEKTPYTTLATAGGSHGTAVHVPASL